MAGTRPPKPPSAIDGYRRLERTRGGGAPTLEPPELPAAAAAPSTRRARGARAVGALRLTAFIAVLATIVGTSVGLASADQQSTIHGAADDGVAARATDTSMVLGPPARDEASSDPAASRSSAERISLLARDTADTGRPKAETKPVAETTERAVGADPEPATPAADSAPSTASSGSAEAPTPTGALPITGDGDSMRIVLAGAAFLLLGMLSQIAGQPLPARAGSRSRS